MDAVLARQIRLRIRLDILSKRVILWLNGKMCDCQTEEEMKIDITYCTVWNYYPKAASLADTLRKEFPDAAIELVKGDKGIFDIAVDDKVVYSKHERSVSLSDVSEGEIVEIIKKLESWDGME